MKSIEEINEKIKRGNATVFTAEEFKQMIRSGEEVTAESVDVVTCATCAIMSGTYAILSIPGLAERGRFKRAKRIWLNGVPAFPGPCPNERLGVVDVIVYGTTHANDEYGGGHLFRDLVEGKEIEVKVETDEGEVIEKFVKIKDLFARMLTTRSDFKNYMGFVNTKEDEVMSIFSVTKMKGAYKEISVSGCGEINPLENDPSLKTINAGTRILVNGSIGYVIGEGTRSSAEKPNLSVFADMHEMSPEFMGGFVTSSGPECISSIAIPIPVVDDTSLNNVMILDDAVKLEIADIHDRIPFMESNYANVWKGTDFEISFDSERCERCEKSCEVEKYCPTRAFHSKRLDVSMCHNCGVCVYLCEAFSGRMGSIEIHDKKVPIKLRQSNRARANTLAARLKKLILEKEFLLTNQLIR